MKELWTIIGKVMVDFLSDLLSMAVIFTVIVSLMIALKHLALWFLGPLS
jgi:hypothetical protein